MTHNPRPPVNPGRFDDLAYPEIAWRCGIDAAEVEIRLADGLFSICRALDGEATVTMRMRPALLSPWRCDWARWRLRRRHRSMGIVDRL